MDHRIIFILYLLTLNDFIKKVNVKKIHMHRTRILMDIQCTLIYCEGVLQTFTYKRGVKRTMMTHCLHTKGDMVVVVAMALQ
jgi:hypothetical protein